MSPTVDGESVGFLDFFVIRITVKIRYIGIIIRLYVIVITVIDMEIMADVFNVRDQKKYVTEDIKNSRKCYDKENKKY